MRSSPKPRGKAPSVDAYLARLPADQRAALERVRRTIQAAVPSAEEGISYQIPAFRVHGKWFIWFGASAKHCALYGVLDQDVADLSSYDTSGRGTIRFQPDHPLPVSTIRKLVKARIARNAAKQSK